MEKTKEQLEAIGKLKQWIKPGSTIFTITRHVSRSGMTRWIDLYIFENNEPIYLSYWVSKALGYKCNNRNHEGLEVGGCGMDMTGTTQLL